TQHFIGLTIGRSSFHLLGGENRRFEAYYQPMGALQNFAFHRVVVAAVILAWAGSALAGVVAEYEVRQDDKTSAMKLQIDGHKLPIDSPLLGFGGAMVLDTQARTVTGWVPQKHIWVQFGLDEMDRINNIFIERYIQAELLKLPPDQRPQLEKKIREYLAQ